MAWLAGTRRRAVLVVLAIGAIGLVGAGCASSPGASTAASPAAAASGAGGKTSANGPSIGGGGAPPTATNADAPNGQPASVQVLGQSPQQTGRQIVSTATMTVKVDDVMAKKEVANAKVRNDFGGQVFSEQTSVSSKSTSVLTYKVAPDSFDRALRELAVLGKLAAEEVKTDDVTQQVVDLDARIRAAEASTLRVGDLVGRTNSVTELANLENEVQRRQAELESLRGQKQTLEARTELATIVLTLTSDDPPPPAPPVEATALPGFFDGLSGGWNLFVNVMTVSGAVIGALLPFAWIGAMGLVIVWALKRRARDGVLQADA